MTIEEAALAAASLVALTGGAYEEARATLRAMAETATRVRCHFAAISARSRSGSPPRETGNPLFPGGLGGSPGWTRTNNPPVNSRMLCQLSYRGSVLSGREL